jgi:hypothetical protein
MLPLALTLLAALAGEPNFPTRNYPVSDFTWRVTSFDLDRDGALDLICHRVYELHWMAGDGTGQYEPRGLVPGTLGMKPLHFADLDGDGWMDAIAWRNYSNELMLYLGDGQGGFAAPQILDPGHFTESAVGDIDGDGDLDCVAWESVGQTLRVYLHTGTGFVRANWSIPKVSCYGLVLGDFDRDGRVDLGVAAGWRFVILHGDGTDSFGPRAELPQFYDLALADLDGDGAPEVLGSAFEGIFAVRHLGERKYARSILCEDVGGSFEVSDADADGDVDLCVQAHGYAQIRYNDGSGRFQAQRTFWMHRLWDSWVFRDLDRDGYADLACPSASQNVAVTLVRPDDRQPVALGRGATARPMDIRDFDGDGELDILLSHDGFIEFLHGDGLGGFAPPVLSQVGSWLGLVSPACVDIDADGDLDVVGNGGMKLKGALNDGTGRFSAPVDLPSVQGWVLASADLDGDGASDVLSLLLGGMQEYSLQCYFSLPGGGVSAHPIGLDGPGWQSWVADFTGDGRADILSRSFEPRGFAVYSWGASGAFELVAFTPRSPNASEYPSEAPCDINGDGHLDVVMVNEHDGEIHALFGDGTGHFPTSLRSDAGDELQELRGIKLLRVDRDPIPDLVATRHDDFHESELVVWPGNGNGSFGAPVVVLAPGGDIHLADFDHDRRSELLFATSHSRAQLIHQR